MKQLIFIMLVVVFMGLLFVACSAQNNTPDPTEVASLVATSVAATISAQPTATFTAVPVSTKIPPTATPTVTPTITPTPTVTTTPTPELDKRIPDRQTYKHTYVISTEYDRFEKKTTISLEPKYAKIMAGKLGEFAAFYFYDDKKPSIPELVMMIFIVSGEDWQYIDCYSLDMLLNDEKHLELESVHNGDVEIGYVVEQIIAIIPIDDFLDIVNAEKVDVKICNDEFSLSNEQLEALRDFASRMKE